MDLPLKAVLSVCRALKPKNVSFVYRAVRSVGRPDPEQPPPPGATLALWLFDTLVRYQVLGQGPDGSGHELRQQVLQEFADHLVEAENKFMACIQSGSSEFDLVRLTLVDNRFVLWVTPGAPDQQPTVYDSDTANQLDAKEFVKYMDFEINSYSLTKLFLRFYRHLQAAAKQEQPPTCELPQAEAEPSQDPPA